MDKEYTRVLFVYPKYPDGQREVLALFPDTVKDPGNHKRYVTGYAHTGQHSACHKSFLRRKPATPAQYKPLAAELAGLGYNLIILNRPDTLKTAFKDIAQDYNCKNDPWGYAMAAAFDIAAACLMRGIDNNLDYRLGAGGPDIEDKWNRRVLMRMNANKLQKLANYTKRVLDMLERHGQAY